ncbi:MAG: type II toxin-antitoxin system VapC family toxin [Flavobacteriales bacterium]|nr:type II toxin-antitoxin system VapC family toxin [Flavobacteriales bacterium]
MKLLLDTHVMLWFQVGDQALPKVAEQAIRSEANEAFVSMVSFWEIGLKHSIGKLPLRKPLDVFLSTITEAPFQILPLDIPHIVASSALPLHHRDPFDRMLIGQAKEA